MLEDKDAVDFATRLDRLGRYSFLRSYYREFTGTWGHEPSQAELLEALYEPDGSPAFRPRPS